MLYIKGLFSDTNLIEQYHQRFELSREFFILMLHCYFENYHVMENRLKLKRI